MSLNDEDVDEGARSEDRVREAQEIARRSLALFGVIGLALRSPREEVLGWLKQASLWSELSPLELAYAESLSPTDRQRINASWRSEALLVLLWALGLVEQMPALNEQCDTSKFQAILPPFADITVDAFIASAQRRSEDVLLDMAADLLDAHWSARDALIHGKAMPAHLDIGIIQERHHAINWVIGYEGLPWDEVPTDT